MLVNSINGSYISIVKKWSGLNVLNILRMNIIEYLLTRCYEYLTVLIRLTKGLTGDYQPESYKYYLYLAANDL